MNWNDWVINGKVTLEKTRKLLRILKALTHPTEIKVFVSREKVNSRESSLWFQEKPLCSVAKSLYSSVVRALGHNLQISKFKKSQKRLISRFSATLQPLLMAEMTSNFFSAHSEAMSQLSNFLLTHSDTALEALQDDTKLSFCLKQWLLSQRLFLTLEKP